MRKLRTLDEVTEGYFRDYPEEIDDYLTELFRSLSKQRNVGLTVSSNSQDKTAQQDTERRGHKDKANL
jgi:hypothetical protein